MDAPEAHMPDPTYELAEAAEQFANLTLAALRSEQGVHIETAIAAVARMAGTFLFRSFDLPPGDAQPGQAYFSDVADEQGPVLMRLLGMMLMKNGITLDPSQFGPRDAHQPELTFLDTQRRIEPHFAAVRDGRGLNNVEAAHAAAMGTALIIIEGQSVLDANTAFGIALAGFVAGCKTVPDPATID